eukprot:scaffold23645_cov284-Cylindrotheca_fusiformis.AAC.1
MNGQGGNDGSNQASQEAQLAFLLNAAGQNGGLSGYHGGGGMAGRLGLSDSSLEEQILQRASALRAEALMQQQQQQRQQQLGYALAALQQQQSALQQQQLSSYGGMNGNLSGLGSQEQEALLARAAALRELGIGNGNGSSGYGGGGGGNGGGGGGGGMDRLQQMELGRLEELEKRRQQLTALANLSGNGGGGGRQGELGHAAELSQDSIRSSTSDADRIASMAATNAAEKSKEDLRKTPGTVIVPCRARGMPMDHNFKTAYFVISEDAKHGEDLVCSYFACRNGGVKFRYCAHCMAPVAKRNFCRRHDHGMSKMDGEANEDDEVSMDHSEGSGQKGSEGIVKKEPKESSTEKRKKDTKDKDASQASLDLLTSTATSKFLDSNKKKRKKASEESKPNEEGKESGEEMDVEAESTNGAPIEGEGSQGLANISSKRRKLWGELLMRRPCTKDPRHLSAWLNEVLTVSEFEIPLDQIQLPPAPAAEDSAGGSGESDDEKKKIEEPKSKKPKTSSDEESTTKAEKEKEEKSQTADGKKSESEDSTPKKSSPKKEKESEDGFAGSFADWRDRKKEKAMNKKGTNSLRK